MSCLTTSATRRSWMVPAAVLIASAAASSHEVPLVPMISVTLYTLMPVSFDGFSAWAPRRSTGPQPARPRPGTGSDRYVRRSPLDLSLALSLGDVQGRCLQIRDRAVQRAKRGTIQEPDGRTGLPRKTSRPTGPGRPA